MRTKTLLLTAAALLAAGIATSRADGTVYSQNIVGYANLATPQSGTYYMMTVPFAIGVSNGANEVFGTTLPDFTQILIWDVPSQSLVGTIYDSTQGNGWNWYGIDDSTQVNPPTLPVGKGFFLLPAGAVTNVFAGVVAVNVGATNTMTLDNSGTYYALGSPSPFSGYLTNQIALTNLPDFSEVLTWDVPSQGLVGSIYDTTQGNGINWYQIDDSTPAPCPTLTVGQAFFVVPAGPYSWQQVLPNN